MQLLKRTLASDEEYLLAHVATVATLATRTATKMGIEGTQLDRVYCCALLHDIGKIEIDDSILSKPGKLDQVEMETMRTHSAIGAQIISTAPGLLPIAPLVRAVHERYDGHGYPDGIRAQDIPIESRIVAVCDAWHAMIEDRVYRKALTRPEAMVELETNAGTQFDPEVVRIFLSSVEA